MGTGFNTQQGSGEYRLQFETDNREYFLFMQEMARKCVDGILDENSSKIISGLTHCQDKDRGCEGCPYYPETDCENRVVMDAIEKLRQMEAMKSSRIELGRRIYELEQENKRMIRQLGYARSERNAAIARMGRLVGQAEAKWVGEESE